MTNSRKIRSFLQQPAVDPNLTSKLVAKFGPKLMREGFTAVPVLVQRYYRQVPGNPRYHYDYEFDRASKTWIKIEESKRLLCEVSHMTPTEYSIMADIWSYWWRGDSQPFPGISEVAEHVDKSVRQVQRYLQRMQDSGWVLSIAQYNIEGKQISNRYDFTPFLRRLVEYLESVGVLEKPKQGTGEGDTSTGDTVTEEAPSRVTFSPPESNEVGEDLSERDESKIRNGANRAEAEKGSVLPNPNPAYSHMGRETIRNEKDTNSTNTNNNDENEQSNHENSKGNTPARAKGVEDDKNGKNPSKLEKMAAARGVSVEAVAAMEAWLKACPSPQVLPILTAGPDTISLTGMMADWSHNLGDGEHTQANNTQVVKIYLFAQDRGLIDEEFVSCMSRTHAVTYKRYKRGELDSPGAFFFKTLKIDVLATLALCGSRPVVPLSQTGTEEAGEAEQQELAGSAPQGFVEELTEKELAELDGHASRDKQAAAGAEELVEMFITNDPAVGFSSQDITFWWADRLLNGVDPKRQLYRYQVYPTNAGRWGFVVFSKENAEDTKTYLSYHEVNDALRPPEERSQD